MEKLIDLLSILSSEHGSGNLQQDILVLVLFVMGLIAVVVLVVNLFKIFFEPKASQADLAERNRMSGLGGKLAKLENDLNSFKTETHRTLSHLKDSLADLETEISFVSPRSESSDKVRTPSQAIVKSSVERVTQAEIEQDPEARTRKKTGEITAPPSVDSLVEDIQSSRDSYTGLHDEEKKTLSSGLSKTRKSFWGKLGSLFGAGGQKISPEILEEAEELLISSDLGVQTTFSILDSLKAAGEKGALFDETTLSKAIRDVLTEELNDEEGLEAQVRTAPRLPFVIMVVGVNGAGKTTSTAKLSALLRRSGSSVLLVAADTFRAGATSQLGEWATKARVEVYRGQEGQKPSTVVYDGLEKAVAGEYDVVIVDTAGRLHTRQNLMQELEGIKNIIKKKVSDGPHETLLVIDGTSGQNALQQAKEFHQISPISGVVVTKLDGSSKGGIVVAVRRELGVPIRYVGVGEGINDLRPFDSEEFISSLLGEESFSARDSEGHAEQRRERRKTSQY